MYRIKFELILVLGLVSHPGPRPNIYFFWGKMSGFDLEINSMHFDIEISKFFKIFDTQYFWVQTFLTFWILTYFLKFSLIFWTQKLFILFFLISTPKYIELNSESGSRWVFRFGFGPGFRPKTQVFLGLMSDPKV